jgi:hypothetical protein
MIPFAFLVVLARRQPARRQGDDRRYYGSEGAAHMFKRLLSALAIPIVTVGTSLAWGKPSDAAPQSVSALSLSAPTERRPGWLRTRPESAVDWQMLSLERRARVDMLLYPGQFGQRDWASTVRALGPVALSLSASK